MNTPLFIKQAIKQFLSEQGVSPTHTQIIMDNYSSEEAMQALAKIESCIALGLDVDEAIAEAHRIVPKLELIKSHKDIEHYMWHNIMKNTTKEHKNAIAGLWYLAHTTIHGQYPDTKWIDPPLAGKNISIYILNNYNLVRKTLGRNTPELEWVEARQFYKCKFKSVINDLPPDLERLLPDMFTFYKALEHCMTTDDFRIHESVLPRQACEPIQAYYDVEFVYIK